MSGIEHAPERLWLRGRLELLARVPRVAVVGTRAPSPYGDAQARRFADALARAGVTVVSGLARGIDHAAHEAVLDAGGSTIACLGNGVDRPWPASALVERMLEHGLLLSEFEPGTPPRAHHFPLRNRIISGLCTGVVVVEAAHASGSLITARWANDQGRELWALPGRVDHPASRGTHRLIREGAELVEGPEEILAALGLHRSASSNDARGRACASRAGRELDTLATRLLGALMGETLSADDFTERLAVDAGQVLARLAELELAGLVARGPGGLYRLVP